ncbi:MAG: WXG100 family type VII secretion target [Clostridia bacterium]|nr:WXG100 family type VII secretion target [Clostridia bacterium]
MRIIVTPAELEKASAQVSNLAEEYTQQYRQLFSEVDAMGSAWQGVDNQAFTNQIKGFEDDFIKMVTLLGDYANFLKYSAQHYTEVQNNIASAATKLSN